MLGVALLFVVLASALYVGWYKLEWTPPPPPGATFSGSE
jgi:hypothetical protein